MRPGSERESLLIPVQMTNTWVARSPKPEVGGPRGWGAAYDLGYSDVLGQTVCEAYYSEKAAIFGSVCHVVLGFIRARDCDSKMMIAGRKMTGVSDKRVKE